MKLYRKKLFQGLASFLLVPIVLTSVAQASDDFEKKIDPLLPRTIVETTELVKQTFNDIPPELREKVETTKLVKQTFNDIPPELMEEIVSYEPGILCKIILINKNANNIFKELSSALTYFCKTGFLPNHKHIVETNNNYSNLLSPHYYKDFYKSFPVLVFNLDISTTKLNEEQKRFCNQLNTELICHFSNSVALPKSISGNKFTPKIPDKPLQFSFLKLIVLDNQLAKLNPKALDKISQYFSDIKTYNEKVSPKSYRENFFPLYVKAGKYLEFIFNLVINQKDASLNKSLLPLANQILLLHKKIALKESSERYLYNNLELDQLAIIRNIPINFHNLPQQISDGLIIGEKELLRLSQECLVISEEMKLLIRLG